MTPDSLFIDLGMVGPRPESSQPFSLHLDASRLTELLRSAEDALRLYELLLIQRPGDVWDYLDVRPVHLPDFLAVKLAKVAGEAREKAGKMARLTRRDESEFIGDVQESRLPLLRFEEFIPEFGYETQWLRWAWIGTRQPMTEFVMRLFGEVGAVQRRLDGDDPLTAHVAEAVRRGTHPFSFSRRDSVRSWAHRYTPHRAGHMPGFYRKLDELLRSPSTSSVWYKGFGDHHVIRALATEQRHRASVQGNAPGEALHIRMLTSQRMEAAHWDGDWEQEKEVLADLMVISYDLRWGCPPISALATWYLPRVPGAFLLGHERPAIDGLIDGYSLESGDGWTLYRSQAPESGCCGR